MHKHAVGFALKEKELVVVTIHTEVAPLLGQQQVELHISELLDSLFRDLRGLLRLGYVGEFYKEGWSVSRREMVLQKVALDIRGIMQSVSSH